jgi:hypothetical protein
VGWLVVAYKMGAGVEIVLRSHIARMGVSRRHAADCHLKFIFALVSGIGSSGCVMRPSKVHCARAEAGLLRCFRARALY